MLRAHAPARSTTCSAHPTSGRFQCGSLRRRLTFPVPRVPQRFSGLSAHAALFRAGLWVFGGRLE